MNHYHLHDLLVTALNTGERKLILNNGVSLQEEWPQLYNIFHNNLFHQNQVITLQQMLSGSVYVPLPKKGISYAIDTNRTIIFKGVKPLKYGLISSVERMTFYAIKKLNHYTMIAQYKFIDENGSVKMVKTIDFFTLCGVDGSHIVMKVNQLQCLSPIVWDVSYGFVDNDRFYLVSNQQKIFSFKRVVFDQLGETTSYESMPISNFLQCNGSKQPQTTKSIFSSTTTTKQTSYYKTTNRHNVSSTTPKNLYIGAILIIVLIMITFLIPIVLCVLRFISNNQRKQIEERKIQSFQTTNPSYKDNNDVLNLRSQTKATKNEVSKNSSRSKPKINEKNLNKTGTNSRKVNIQSNKSRESGKGSTKRNNSSTKKSFTSRRSKTTKRNKKK